MQGPLYELAEESIWLSDANAKVESWAALVSELDDFRLGSIGASSMMVSDISLLDVFVQIEKLESGLVLHIDQIILCIIYGVAKISKLAFTFKKQQKTTSLQTTGFPFPFFGKKYQLKFANEAMSGNHCLVHFPSLTRLAREAGLEYVEIQNLTEFYDDNRTQFAPMLGNCGASLVDPRGKLVARSYDILGLYSTFVFQKPDPDAIPPIVTPDLNDADNAHEEERLWRQQAAVDDGRRSQPDVIPLDPDQKGILGPGPADLRL
ncbi:mRNA cap guanine-N7 methyltransferase 2-like [Lolium rigidum]|uniref:mRNA cap guanine-N7 methyltransferase 2-like n=1 Tax=Lolium rigidum TaxID=89674 RepID=UPI001F5C3CCD|nr:mRNA cap guanine-N7 methyltransferase 2-like [Lolium rigidum]